MDDPSDFWWGFDYSPRQNYDDGEEEDYSSDYDPDDDWNDYNPYEDH